MPKGRPKMSPDAKAERVAKRKADGERFRVARGAMFKTQAEIAAIAAELLGRSITKQAVCAWETGRVGTPAVMMEWAQINS